VTTALASAKPMKMLLKIEAVRKKLMVRMTAPKISTRTHVLSRQPRARAVGSWRKIGLWIRCLLESGQEKTGPLRTVIVASFLPAAPQQINHKGS
jgi:hypothetical protein